MPAVPTPPRGHRPGADTPGPRGGAQGGGARERGPDGSRGRGEAADATQHGAPGRRVEETSAGGLVLDRLGADAQVVLIGRHDRRGRLLWSLPKGHVESGETHQDTAVREVQEETGIDGRVIGRLGSIDFWFTADGRRVHKTVHHFLLLATGGELSDSDIEVAEVAWVPLVDAAARLAYPTERALLDRVPGILAESA